MLEQPEQTDTFTNQKIKIFKLDFKSDPKYVYRNILRIITTTKTGKVENVEI